MMSGQKWKDMRIKLVPTFTSGRIKAMFPLMQECSEQFDGHLTQMANRNQIFEAKVTYFKQSDKYLTLFFIGCAWLSFY